MTAFEYLKSLPRYILPVSTERSIRQVSNSELYRMLMSKSVKINGVTPQPYEEISFPITELTFFPSSKRKTTLVKE